MYLPLNVSVAFHGSVPVAELLPLLLTLDTAADTVVWTVCIVSATPKSATLATCGHGQLSPHETVDPAHPLHSAHTLPFA